MNKYLIAGFMIFFILCSSQVEALPSYSDIFDVFYENYVSFFGFNNKITGYQIVSGEGRSLGDGSGGTCVGIDNDGDGFCVPEDCDDNNSTTNPRAMEVCDDGYDNDCNGDVDCVDSNCDGKPGNVGGDICEHDGELNCADNFDNDGDGDVDCADSECDGLTSSSPRDC